MIDIPDPCADCKRLSPATLTEADYNRALALLLTRDDLTAEERERARAWLDAQRAPVEASHE